VSRLVVTGGRFHRYSLDGERVPNVTTIINKATGKEGLIRWAAREAAIWAQIHAEDAGQGESWIREAAAAHERKRDASGLAGRQVHSIAERLVFGEPVATEDPDTGAEYPDDVVRMGEQVARFMDRWDVTPETAVVEAPVFHEDAKYAGRLDLVATLRGGDRWLVDYKTGESGVWPETGVQLAAYSHATHIVIGERDMLMPPIQRCAALWVRPDMWELIPVKTDDHQFNVFRHMTFVAEWASLKLEDTVGAPLPLPEVRAS
jgi:hypothetical protein